MKSDKKYSSKKKKYFIYILKCSDDTLYTGYTTNLEKRLFAHNNLDVGAKYTKMRRPVEMVYSEKFKTLGGALSREHIIKKLSRKNKFKLFLN